MTRVAVYSITRNRTNLTKRSFGMLRRWAGIEFDHYVFDNGSALELVLWLYKQASDGKIAHLKTAGTNYGQNIAANYLLDTIEKSGNYDYIVRWDNDMVPRTRRFLKKLVVSADAFVDAGVAAVIAPAITKLKYPPEPFMEGDDIGFKYEVVRVLGGQCRLHPASIFDGWRFNRFGALGFGEANEMADLCYQGNIPKIKLPWIEVEHYQGEDAQIKGMPEYFNFVNREVGRYVGYGL